MNFKIGTATQWFLVLCGVVAYGLWLNIQAAQNHAILGAGCFGLWLGMVSAHPGEGGKRDRRLICLAVLLSVAAAWVGAGRHLEPPDDLMESIRYMHLHAFNQAPDPTDTLIRWLAVSILGWFTGFTAAMVQQGWWQTLRFGIALALTITAVLPWSVVGICAFFGSQEEADLTAQIFTFIGIEAVLLNVTLLTVAGFRREPRSCRAWLTLGVAAVLSLGIWGVAEGYYQWDARRLQRSCSWQPEGRTATDRHAMDLLQQVIIAWDRYDDRLRIQPPIPPSDADDCVMLPSRSERLAPPIFGESKWLPVRAITAGDTRPSASEEFKARMLDADADPAATAFFDAFEAFLKQDRLIAPSDPATPVLQNNLPLQLQGLEQWLVGRAQLRHYTGDTAGTIHYLDLALRMGEVWPGDYTLVGQWARIAIDQIALDAIVSLGPDGPEYVDFYRDCLRRGLARHYEQISEPRFLVSYLDAARSGNFVWCRLERSKPSEFIWQQNPLTLRLLGQHYRAGEQAQTQYPTVRQQVADGIPLAATPARNFVKGYRYVARAALLAEARLQTGLALKLYRSLHGEYPELLQQLVPELLPLLPNDPETGKPLPYRKVENYFELGGGSEPPLRPVADY